MAHACRVQCDWHSQGGQLDEQGRNAGRAGHHPDKALGDRHHYGGCNEAQSQRPLDHRSAVLLIVIWPSTSVLQKKSHHIADDPSLCIITTHANAMSPTCV